MSEQNEAPKKKQGHPPWTEEQKQARRELNARKRAEREAEEAAAQKKYAESKKRGRPPWTEEQKAARRELMARKRVKLDEERKRLIAENPTKTKEELGIHSHWKPKDGDDDGYYKMRIREAKVAISLPPINIDNPAMVEERIDQYLDFCRETEKPPNMVGMANWLGVDNDTLYAWKNGRSQVKTHQPVIKRAIMMMEEMLIDLMMTNKINPANGIFVLKNHYQYRDQQDIVVEPRQNIEESMSADDIARRYLNDGASVGGANAVETTFSDEDTQK